jgi:hypothetical protein
LDCSILGYAHESRKTKEYGVTPKQFSPNRLAVRIFCLIFAASLRGTARRVAAGLSGVDIKNQKVLNIICYYANQHDESIANDDS